MAHNDQQTEVVPPAEEPEEMPLPSMALSLIAVRTFELSAATSAISLPFSG
jgi:hypothetical protein